MVHTKLTPQSKFDRLQKEKEEQLNKAIKDLQEAGFQEGIDFIVEENYYDELRENYYYGSTVMGRMFRGSILLRYLRYRPESGLKYQTTGLYIEDGKFEALSITGNYRHYTAKTLYKKLQYKNQMAKNEANYEAEYKAGVDFIINQLKEEYPSAEVTYERDEFVKGHRRPLKVITVKFKNGSYVKLQYTSHDNSVSMLTKFDAERDELDYKQTLEIFNNQNQ